MKLLNLSVVNRIRKKINFECGKEIEKNIFPCYKRGTKSPMRNGQSDLWILQTFSMGEAEEIHLEAKLLMSTCPQSLNKH